ncbi:hypothetical protein MmiEs2_02590 [Methanimicrococcus stummii]|uniref:Metallo-beta-lactamase domain-containing protein n=1 Tax=Methanimicrococcus stummii TaxID=3028294 RepID=A0AA96V8C1_9EURY|nr:hypothetical protein [Methanimicrococcus sp. Es2]WNY28078.1 hypothetical protein MmiEs2_02590 [Methanimicrococcus sp. Es2]
MKLKLILVLAVICIAFSGCLENGDETKPTPEIPSNVIVKEFGDVKLHSFLSDSVSPVIVEHDKLIIIDYPGDSEIQATAFKEYVESFGKPIDRIIISHVDEAHWINIQKYFPNVSIYSVDADEIMAMATGSNLTVTKLNDDSKMTIDGVKYEFETNREIGAWAIKLSDQKAVYVEHLGYVNLHVLIAPLEPRAEMLKDLEAQGYIWFMSGHGVPATASEFVDNVEKYYSEILKAVAESETPDEAKTIIMQKYPNYVTEEMLDAMLPQFF